jgi:uncharacterized protein YyaL (SSP411 family)
LPTAVVVPVTGAHQSELARLLPWTAALTARGGRATAYVCRDFACEMPTTAPNDLDAQLRELAEA